MHINANLEKISKVFWMRNRFRPIWGQNCFVYHIFFLISIQSYILKIKKPFYLTLTLTVIYFCIRDFWKQLEMPSYRVLHRFLLTLAR